AVSDRAGRPLLMPIWMLHPWRWRILDISSKGVRFTTERLLKSGTLIELSLNWPTRINDACPLKLVIHGCVIRSEDSIAAMKIEHYEFRTRSPSIPLQSR